MDAGPSPGPGQSSFAQGFVVGQLVLIVALVFLFRYLYVADLPATLEQERRALIARTEAIQRSLEAKRRGRAPHSESEGARRGLQDVLQKTQYEMGAHAPETLDWLNVILAQTIARYRDAVVGYAPPGAVPADPASGMPSLQNAEKAAAKRLAEHILNTAVAGRTMNMLDTITVTDIDFGTRYPRLTHARVRPSESPDVARLEVDFDYTDQISFGIDTKLLMNFPQLRFGSLALGMCLRVQQLCGTLGVEICTQRPAPGAPPRELLRVCVYPDFVLDARVSSIFGSKQKLQDVPKIEEILVTRMRMFIQERLVWPRFWDIPLPSLRTANL